MQTSLVPLRLLIKSDGPRLITFMILHYTFLKRSDDKCSFLSRTLFYIGATTFMQILPGTLYFADWSRFSKGFVKENALFVRNLRCIIRTL